MTFESAQNGKGLVQQVSTKRGCPCLNFGRYVERPKMDFD